MDVNYPLPLVVGSVPVKEGKLSFYLDKARQYKAIQYNTI